MVDGWIERSIGGTNKRRFNFSPGSIINVSTNIEVPDLNQTTMPAAGPMSNFAFDFNGVNKTITMDVRLKHETSSVVVDQAGNPVTPAITSIEMQKYWLETLCDGMQTGFEASIPLENYSVESSTAGQLTFPGNPSFVLPARFARTKVWCLGLSYSNSEDKPTQLIVSLRFFVAQS